MHFHLWSTVKPTSTAHIMHSKTRNSCYLVWNINEDMS